MKKHFKKKKRLGSYPFFEVVLTMTLALSLLGTFALLLLLTDNLTRRIKQSIEIQVFLKQDVSESERIKLGYILSDLDFVARENGAASIRYIPKTEAAKEFSEEIGEDFVEYIGKNPLSDVFVLHIDEQYQTPAHFGLIKEKIESLASVQEAAYVEKLVEKINKNLRQVSILLIGLSLALFIAVVVIIHHAIRLALFSQRFLIRSMQLVGATSSFILRPFLLRSLGYGLFASLLAVAGIYALLNVGNKYIEQLILLQNQQQTIGLFIVLVFLGIFTNYISTYFAIRRYLKMSLDDLY